MFDLLGWTWEYEPVDLNGWIPDFVITNARQRLYVEVKPVFSFDDEVKRAIKKAELAFGHDSSDEALNEIAENTEVMVVGAGVIESEYGDYCFGWISDGIFDYWPEAILRQGCENNPSVKYGLTAGTTGYYAERIKGCKHACCEWDGDHHYYPAAKEDFEELWAEAGNRTQWKRPA